MSGKFCSAQLIASFIVKRAAVVSNDCAFVFLRCVASIVRMPEGSCRSGRAVYGPGVPKRCAAAIACTQKWPRRAAFDGRAVARPTSARMKRDCVPKPRWWGGV